MEYNEAISNSIIIKGNQFNNNNITIKRTIKDIEKDTTKTYLTSYLLSNTLPPSLPPTSPTSPTAIPPTVIPSLPTKLSPLFPFIEIQKVDIDAYDLKYNYNIKLINNSDGKYSIEVLQYNSLLYRLDVSDIHEKFIGDEWFGGYSFSPNGKYFVYVAVPKKEKITSFFDNDVSEESTFIPNRYNYDEDWGEKYEGVSRLGLFVLDIENKITKEISGINLNDTVGQPTFTPCSQGVVYTAWLGSYRKLGMIYCYQRPCEIRLTRFIENIFESTNQNPIQHFTISTQFSLARSPRFNYSTDNTNNNNNNNDSYLVFLGSKKSIDTHNSSSSLYSINWNQYINLLNNLQEVTSEQLVNILNQSLRVHISNEINNTSNNVKGDKLKQVTIADYLFPGLYCGSLPSKPFITKDLLLLETQWRSQAIILVVNIQTNQIFTLHNHSSNISSSSSPSSFPIFTISSPFQYPYENIESLNTSHTTEKKHSWLTSCENSNSILDIHPNVGILLTTSNPTTPQSLVHISTNSFLNSYLECLRNYTTQENNNNVIQQFVESSFFENFSSMSLTTIKQTNSSSSTTTTTTTRSLNNKKNNFEFNRNEMSSYILHTSYNDTNDDDNESILILPPQKSSGKLPGLLVCPHGGPHSAFTTSYVAQYSDYLSYIGGYAILLVNYRGSTGYGQEALESLPGNIGTIDVKDVYDATLSVLSLNPPLVDSSPSNRAIFGGSHGGFLTAHMIGQFPELYAASALRNPVINIPPMFITSDIPDWTVIESCGLGSYNFGQYQLPSNEQLVQMYESSPIKYVKNVIAPVLLCLGAKDKRVPWSQGLQYYYTLKSQRNITNDQNSTCQLRVYKEADHAIDKPNSEADQWISIKNWFDRFLK